MGIEIQREREREREGEDWKGSRNTKRGRGSEREREQERERETEIETERRRGTGREKEGHTTKMSLIMIFGLRLSIPDKLSRPTMLTTVVIMEFLPWWGEGEFQSRPSTTDKRGDKHLTTAMRKFVLHQLL